MPHFRGMEPFGPTTLVIRFFEKLIDPTATPHNPVPPSKLRKTLGSADLEHAFHE